MTHNTLIDEIKKLPPEQRLELIDETYETLASNNAAFPLTNEQTAELTRRFEYYKKHPDELISIEQFETNLNRRAAKQ